MADAQRECDGNCNECPVINHPNARMLTAILNRIYGRFGEAAYSIVQGACPNMTVCYDCRIDDFCHIEGCRYAAMQEEAESDG